MEVLQEIKDSVPVEGAVFGSWLETLTPKQKSKVTTARRQGYIAIVIASDGSATVQKGSA